MIPAKYEQLKFYTNKNREGFRLLYHRYNSDLYMWHNNIDICVTRSVSFPVIIVVWNVIGLHMRSRIANYFL